MPYGFLDALMGPSVQAAQAAHGVDQHWANFKGNRAFERFTPEEIAFIAERDSFYMATMSETGWPYIQHRGGPKGFLKVLDNKTLGFPDFRGNLQYISVGNLGADDRACLFLMDYPRQARLKILAHVEVRDLSNDPGLASQLATVGYKARIERAMLLHLETFDWNCPQHITPRWTAAEINGAVKPLQEKIASLEAELALLRQRLKGK